MHRLRNYALKGAVNSTYKALESERLIKIKVSIITYLCLPNLKKWLNKMKQGVIVISL